MGEVAVTPVKVLCSSIGECQGHDWEWVGWVAGQGEGIGGFGDSILNVNEENI